MSKRIDDTNCHCLKIWRSAENLTKFYNDFLAPTGITARQNFLLHKIKLNSGCSVKVLSEQTQLERSTLARTLKPLMQAGYIFDCKEAGRRDSRLVLTDSGEKVCAEAQILWSQAQKALEEKIGMETISALENLLETLQVL